MNNLPALRTHEQLEAIVERGLATFVEVGQALAEIRDRRTYRETHGDFDSYCRERWGFSRRRADQQIEAARTVASLGTTVPTPPPANEAQARELARVPEPERPVVWQKATERAAGEDRQVTAADVRVVAAPAPSAPALPTPAGPAGTDPMQVVLAGEKAVERIADGFRWIRHAGGPDALVAAAEAAPTASFTLAGWRHDFARFRSYIDEVEAALNAAGGLRRIK